MHLTLYSTLVFDCDGVVLDSNGLKTQAFFNAAAPYGREAAQKLVAYHKANGGISRFHKFEYFLRHIVNLPAERANLAPLLEAYATEARQGLLSARVNPALRALRAGTPGSRWLLVSGGAQDELRDVFRQLEIDTLFDGGIFGSPDSKQVILEREQSRGNLARPALFFGDSRHDHEVARDAGLDFVFLSDWTEFADWQVYQRDTGMKVFPNLQSLLVRAGLQ